MSSSVERSDESSSISPPRIYVIDDEISVLEATRDQLEAEGFCVVAYSDPAEFVQQFEDLEPGVVISDQRMPTLDGLDVQKVLKARLASFPLILVSGYPQTRVAVEAMRQGAITVLDKPYQLQELLAAVDAGFEALKKGLANAIDLPARLPDGELYLDRLSPREREVVDLVYSGATNKSIGITLNISVKTVEKHRGKSMRKLQVSSLAGLIRLVDRELRDAS